MFNLLDMLFPKRCMFCNTIIQDNGYICENCFEKNKPSILTRNPDGMLWKAVIAPFYYDGAAKRVIKRYKFSPSPSDAAKMASCIAPLIVNGYLGEEDFDFMTWVPSKNKLAFMRGYNQTELLAKEIFKKTKFALPRPKQLLVKQKATKHQYEVAMNERHENIKDAFALAQNVNVNGKKILIIDDVMTTGSTISECAGVLLSAGAADVYAAVFALTRFSDDKN